MGILGVPFSLLSSAFVPVESMPAALELFAECQPLTFMVDAGRGLLLGDAATATFAHARPTTWWARWGGRSRSSRSSRRSRCAPTAATETRAPAPARILQHGRVPWELGRGVVELPDGARLRGRALRHGAAPEPLPQWGLYLLGRPPAPASWPARWLRWPDFWLPGDAEDARSAFAQAHELARDGARVEVACHGGAGRTGTALACIAQLGGVRPAEAVGWVRAAYDPDAVETPWQRRYVRRYLARARAVP